jgi:very-short-patch-repair endonuclease
MYGDPNYVELSTQPILGEDASDPFDSEAGRRLLGRIRRDRNRQTIFLGYPVRLKLIRSRKGWEGIMVEPILLFPFQAADSKYVKPTLADDLPQINFKALRGLANAGEAGLMEEAIQLAEELGLGNSPDEQPDIDELLARLFEIRSDWDWRERINPYALSTGSPLSRLNETGIFNRAILVTAERSPYVKGLESELGVLQSVDESKYKNTSLGVWLNQQTIESQPPDQRPLLEVVPLNTEQRQAVQQALSNSLTVITGPPGTGKSQVVTSILVNAAWHGKTVLFASKNNKAVDVVETRANALGPRPVLLRLGPNQYQSRLAEYLVSLLAATSTADDQSQYCEYETIHAQLQQRSDLLGIEVQTLVSLRNEVDQLEQRVEHVRQEVGKEVFRRFRATNRAELEQTAQSFQSDIDQANKAKQPFVTRLFWPFVRRNRFAQLGESGRVFRQTFEQIGLPVPAQDPDTGTFDQWIEFGGCLENRVAQLRAAQEYFGKLATLTDTRSLEDLSKQWKELNDDLVKNSDHLWRAWLRLLPSRMTPEQRKLIGDCSALLQMIISASAENRQLGQDAFRRYHQLFPQITSIFSCWAVTSLSARGRVPFDSHFFDLLVIDEASQCDIASALPLLYRARRVVVIGDPMQLRHISTLSKHQDQQLLSKHRLMDDYPGWAYSTQSIFDLASSLCRSEDIVALRDHHRSHSDIIDFSNEMFYEGRLRVATQYDRLKRPSADGPAVRWIDVQGNAIRPGVGGAVNETEAHTVVDEIERLVRQGYQGSIGVVSPFRAQANRIRDLVAQRDLSLRCAEMEFLADTVHKFQGDQRDVMLLSPVVSSGISDGALGFLRSNPNLFNVAITRARAALIVVGDKSAALNCNVEYLARFAAYTARLTTTERRGTCINHADLGPDYPPVPHPERVSDWERLFYRALYRAGARPILQHCVERYDLDFAVLVGERCLNIEIDGERYHRNWDGELCRRDEIRNQRLMELGWDVMRFWVYQVRDDLGWCIRRVQNWIDRGNQRTEIAERGAADSGVDHSSANLAAWASNEGLIAAGVHQPPD